MPGENFRGVAFHPEMKNYIIGTTNGGKAVLFKVNYLDWTLVKEDKIDIGTKSY
jgi:hypothetical protein